MVEQSWSRIGGGGVRILLGDLNFSCNGCQMLKSGCSGRNADGLAMLDPGFAYLSDRQIQRIIEANADCQPVKIGPMREGVRV